MAAKEARQNIAQASPAGNQRNYNKKNTPDRIELMKYCRFCKKHTAHRETR